MVCEEGIYQAQVPKIDAVNTVGCGDSMIAGFAVGMSQKISVEGSLRLASAISAAAALREETGFFVKEDMERIFKEVKITKFKIKKSEGQNMAEMIQPAMVPKVKLYTGEEIPCVGMGTFGSDRFTPEQVSNAVAGAIRCGYRMFDCAACYGNEDQIGEVFHAAFEEGV